MFFEKKAVSGILLALLLASVFVLAFNIQPVRAQGTIYIRADGSIDPSTAPISTVDNVTYILTGNTSYPAYYGIVVERSNVMIDGSGYTVQGDQSGNGLSLTSISNVTIRNINVVGFEYGIYLESSSNNTISGSNATANGVWTGGVGIFLYSSSSNTVIENNATANYRGIYLSQGSSNNTVIGNNATANWEGIDIEYYSNSNTVSGNNVTANPTQGIELWLSSSNTVIGNHVTANGVGIHDEQTSNNTIIGNNATANADGIFVGSCRNSTVIGNNVTANSYDGILVGESSNSTVSANNATANGYYGIALEASSNNNIFSNNKVTANSHGIFLSDYSHSNTVIGNNVTANSCGVYLNYSSSNTVNGNNITANTAFGILLYLSSNNTFYHNNIINNSQQVSISPSGYANVWDDGYPSGGNYWSDHNGTDSFSGAFQNETGSDGIGDTAYTVDANNTDNYPLMNPWFCISGDINFDGKVSLTDLVILAIAYGSKPGDANWNPNADINGDGKVSLSDLVLLAIHYGQHNP